MTHHVEGNMIFRQFYHDQLAAASYLIGCIAKGEALDEVVVTNTIPLTAEAAACTKIRQLSVAPLIAETINRIAHGESVMSLFSDQT